MDSERIGPLECQIYGQSQSEKPGVIFFHGYGADMSDLYPLAEVMDPEEKATWYFPNGPLSVVIGPGFYGRAWYQIDMARLGQLMRKGETADLSGQRPKGLDSALDFAMEFTTSVLKSHKKIVIGGFSQGAILSTELATRLGHELAGVVLMSGTLLDQETWKNLLSKKRGLPYIQSHGHSDAVLSLEMARKLNALLNTSGWRGDFLPFTGGHEIPTPVVQRVKSFIAKKLWE
jgi:phospholipase/carboxylesterase